jgi:hypothetical protein
LAAESESPTAAQTSEPATDPSPSEPPEADPRVVRAAVRTVRRYLRDWVELGPAASSRYLVSGPGSIGDDGPRVSSAELTSFEVFRVDGPSSVVLSVSLDLDFVDSPLAWNQGLNDRFVTATRTGDHGRYRLEFATGP